MRTGYLMKISKESGINISTLRHEYRGPWIIGIMLLAASKLVFNLLYENLLYKLYRTFKRVINYKSFKTI
jgi:hypothetical protein